MMAPVNTSIEPKDLCAYVAGQVNNFFPDDRKVGSGDLQSLMPEVLPRLEHCFSHVDNKYFWRDGQPVFDHLHGDQYAMFLYMAAREAFVAGDRALASKLYLLNKALHGIDAFYEVELPSVFLFIHPLATVLGRGSYSDYLLVYQRCGVGSNHDVYPVLNEHVTLHPGSAVLGRCNIGRNCTVAAESLVLDRDLPADTVYIGNPRDFSLRPTVAGPTVWRIGQGGTDE